MPIVLSIIIFAIIIPTQEFHIGISYVDGNKRINNSQMINRIQSN